MENAEDLRLIKFKAAVFEEAEAQQKEAEKTADEEKLKLIKDAEDEILKNAYDKIQRKIFKIRNGLRKEFADTKFRCKKDILVEREKLKKELFDNIINRIIEYSSSDEYKNNLILNIKKIIKDNNLQSYSIKLSAKDKDFTEQIKKEINADVVIIIDKSIIYGGFKIIDNSKNIIFDETFDNALKSEQDRFCTYSGMNI